MWIAIETSSDDWANDMPNKPQGRHVIIQKTQTNLINLLFFMIVASVFTLF